jgi:ATP-dependent RNA helicase RhlE
VNFDVPNVPETYVHRIGRTGRAGASGKAVSFCDPEERGFIRAIERLMKKTIPVLNDHPVYPAGERIGHTPPSHPHQGRPAHAGHQPHQPRAAHAHPVEARHPHPKHPQAQSQPKPHAPAHPARHPAAPPAAPRPAHMAPGGGAGAGHRFQGTKRPQRPGRHPMSRRPR